MQPPFSSASRTSAKIGMSTSSIFSEAKFVETLVFLELDPGLAPDWRQVNPCACGLTLQHAHSSRFLCVLDLLDAFRGSGCLNRVESLEAADFLTFLALIVGVSLCLLRASGADTARRFYVVFPHASTLFGASALVNLTHLSRCSSADFLGSDSALLGRRLLICRDVELGMVVFDRVLILISISKGSIRLQYGDCTFSSLLQLQYNVAMICLFRLVQCPLE